MEVQKILPAIPKIKRHLTYSNILKLVESLKKDAQFEVNLLGKSELGRPIHHIKYGNGHLKALFVGYPHPNEPIGGDTCYALLKLLKQKNSYLLTSDIEWHIIPCIDPDGAILNEGWSTKKFNFKRFLDFYFRQIPSKQIEWSFPIHYKNLQFNEPTNGTKALMTICEEVKPDFCFSLHNAMIGGAFFYISKDIGKIGFNELYKLLQKSKIPLHLGESEISFVKTFSPAIYESLTVQAFYDQVAKHRKDPENSINRGAGTYEYLKKFNTNAISFYCELPYVKHKSIASKKKSRHTRGKLLLRNAHEYAYLMTSLHKEWIEIHKFLNYQSPFFPGSNETFKNFKSSDLSLKEILEIPNFSEELTEGEALDLNLFSYYQLLNLSMFGRLVEDSILNPPAKNITAKKRLILAKKRIKKTYEEIFEAIAERVDLSTFEDIDLGTLVKVQLGSGLIILNNMLEKRH